MARGKIQIKRIENSMNRQVTYSKRRKGLFKKANELTVLCDAKVSIIMVSSTNKIHEYTSPCASTKQFYDKYQQVLGIDLWSSHYQRMQEDMQKLKETGRRIQREIRRRMGDCLEDMSLDELRCLEHDMDNAVAAIRERKYKVISNQIETTKKKVRNVEEIHRGLLHEFDAIAREDPSFGLVDNGVEYENVLGYNVNSRMLALRLQPSDPNLHSGGGSCVTTYTLL